MAMRCSVGFESASLELAGVFIEVGWVVVGREVGQGFGEEGVGGVAVGEGAAFVVGEHGEGVEEEDGDVHEIVVRDLGRGGGGWKRVEPLG